MPPVPSEGEISPLRFASVEMTGGGGPAFFKSVPEGHGASPFGGWRHHLSPASGGTIKLRKAIFFIKWLYAKHGLFCPRLRGKSGVAR